MHNDAEGNVDANTVPLQELKEYVTGMVGDQFRESELHAPRVFLHPPAYT